MASETRSDDTQQDDLLSLHTVSVVQGIDANKLCTAVNKLANDINSKPSQPSIESQLRSLQEQLQPQLDALGQRLSTIEEHMQQLPSAASIASACDSAPTAASSAEKASDRVDAMSSEVASLQRSLNDMQSKMDRSFQDHAKGDDSHTNPSIEKLESEVAQQREEVNGVVGKMDDLAERLRSLEIVLPTTPSSTGPADKIYNIAGTESVQGQLGERVSAQESDVRAGDLNDDVGTHEQKKCEHEARIKALEDAMENAAWTDRTTSHAGEADSGQGTSENPQETGDWPTKPYYDNNDSMNSLSRQVADLKQQMQEIKPQAIEGRVDTIESKLEALPDVRFQSSAEGNTTDYSLQTRIAHIEHRIHVLETMPRQHEEQFIGTHSARNEDRAFEALEKANTNSRQIDEVMTKLNGMESSIGNKADKNELDAVVRFKTYGSTAATRSAEASDEEPISTNNISISELAGRLELVESRIANLPSNVETENMKQDLKSLQSDLDFGKPGSLAWKVSQLEDVPEKVAQLQKGKEQKEMSFWNEEQSEQDGHGYENTASKLAKSQSDHPVLEEARAKADHMQRQLDEQEKRMQDALDRKADQKQVDDLKDVLAHETPHNTAVEIAEGAKAEEREQELNKPSTTTEVTDAVKQRIGILEGKHNKLRRAHDDLADQLDKLAARHQTQYLDTSRALDDLANQIKEQQLPRETYNQDATGVERSNEEPSSFEKDMLNALEMIAFSCTSMATGKAWKDPMTNELRLGADGTAQTTPDAINEIPASDYSQAEGNVMAFAPKVAHGTNCISSMLDSGSSPLRNIARLLLDGEIKQKAEMKQQVHEQHKKEQSSMRSPRTAELDNRLQGLEDAMKKFNRGSKDPAQLTSDLNKLMNRVKRLEGKQIPPQSGQQVQHPHDGEHAILAGKPVYGYRCMSCDQPLDKLTDDPGNWNASQGLPRSDRQRLVPQPSSGTQQPPLVQHRPNSASMQISPTGPHLPPGGYRSSALSHYSPASRPNTSEGTTGPSPPQQQLLQAHALPPADE